MIAEFNSVEDIRPFSQEEFDYTWVGDNKYQVTKRDPFTIHCFYDDKDEYVGWTHDADDLYSMIWNHYVTEGGKKRYDQHVKHYNSR